MLENFTYRIALKGTSTLNHPLPSYYSAGFLNVEFWSPDRGGRCAALGGGP